MDELKHGLEDRITIINNLTHQAESGINIKLVMAGREIDEDTLRTDFPSNIGRYELASLSLKKIIALIENACANLNISNRIVKDISKSNLFRMLPRTPIAAVLLTKLLQDNQHELPSNLTELYSKYTELSLGRWDIDKGITSQKEYDAINVVITSISRYMIDNDLVFISIDEAKGFFSEYLGQRNLGLNSDQLFTKLIERSDIVLIDNCAGTFSFRHRTFSEYFYAKSLVSSNPNITSDSIELYWAAINFFWVGLLKDCPSVIEKFTQISSPNDRTKFLKLINLGNIMLAGHQTPYHVIEHSIKDIFIEAGDYFCKLRNGEIESPLRQFPEMYMVCIFRYILTEGYSYDFFKEAIGSALIDIEDDDSIDLEIKSTSLFFLSTVYLSVGGDNIFEGMIKKLGTNIPLSIQLAIKHESSEHKLSSPSISKIHRNIKRLLSSKINKGNKAALDMLYERPLESLSTK